MSHSKQPRQIKKKLKKKKRRRRRSDLPYLVTFSSSICGDNGVFSSHLRYNISPECPRSAVVSSWLVMSFPWKSFKGYSDVQTTSIGVTLLGVPPKRLTFAPCLNTVTPQDINLVLPTVVLYICCWFVDCIFNQKIVLHLRTKKKKRKITTSIVKHF